MEHRIVSLIPSATEIVAALGFGDSLVGRSHECDYPPGVELLPVCSQPRIEVAGSSIDIDRAVRSAVQDALSIYSINHDELERLQPTHILTQSQCAVCAVNLSDVESAVSKIVGRRPTIVSLAPMTLTDIRTDIARVADSLGADTATALISSLEHRMDSIRQRTTGSQNRPTVFCMEWLDPLMSAGNWVPELVEIAGGTPVLSQAGQHSPFLSWHELTAADPDILVIMPCGFGIERTREELTLLTNDPRWVSLRAVRNRRVYVADGHHYFNRPGPRIVESAEILYEIIHDGRVPGTHSPDAWISVS